MYHVVAGLLAALRVCAAGPVHGKPSGVLDAGNPSKGFPAQDIPAAAVPLDLAGNFSLPLRPDTERGIQTRVRTDLRPGIPPRGGELVVSIAIEIYWYWRDNDNRAINHLISKRGEVPFENFQYIINPYLDPRAILTPYKLGIAYCWILNGVLIHTNTWPGYIVASVSDTVDHRLVGFLSIENQARASDAASSAVPNDKNLEKALWVNETFNAVTQPGHALAVQSPNNVIERRWFKCLAAMLMYVIANPTTAFMAEKLPPHSSDTTYRFDCNPRPTTIRDQIHVTIFAAAVHNRLTWKVLAEELLVFGSSVARGNSWDTVSVVREGFTTLASLRIRVDVADGIDVPSTVSSETA
ncbi:MAG: hypothetical protein Q9225_005162 [Loekoesia sp. 1 TL-2023]